MSSLAIFQLNSSNSISSLLIETSVKSVNSKLFLPLPVGLLPRDIDILVEFLSSDRISGSEIFKKENHCPCLPNLYQLRHQHLKFHKKDPTILDQL